jgi:NADH dehydrogenase
VAQNQLKRVVIVGGGFAGLNCARRLAEYPGLGITLLDRNNYQQFQPLLYWVATGVLSPDNAAFNLRAVLAPHENVEIKMTEVSSVDLATRTVRTAEGDEYEGDYLVLAAGAAVNFFDIPGVTKHGLPMYSLLDAEQLRSRLLEMLEAADRRGQRHTAEPLRVVVISGGRTGVEVAGAIADLFQRTQNLFSKMYF